MSTTILLNNCNGRPHAKLFGHNAFYDLNTYGTQSNKAVDLRVGTTCIVAQKPDGENLVRFDRYSFEGERLVRDPDSGDDVRVMFGRRLDSVTVPKVIAASHDLYSELFNVNGDFKQVSVIQVSVIEV